MSNDRNAPMNFGDITTAVELVYRDDRRFLVEQLDAAVVECVAKAHRWQGKSLLSLEIGFLVKDGRIAITAALATKTPSPATVPIAAYVDREGRLVADDPYQLRLQLEPTPFPAKTEGGEGR